MTAVRNISVQEMVTEDEWKTRVDLAAFFRLVAHHCMTDLVLGQIWRACLVRPTNS